VSRWAGVWLDPLTRRRARLRECPAAGPDHEGRHRPDADDAWQTSGKAAGDCGEAPNDRKEVAEQAARGVPTASREADTQVSG
jgi:hypothetical protein